MKIVFRVDASDQMGHGHVMRCLALANGLQAAGHVVSFICRELPGNLVSLIESNKMEVATLPYRGDFKPSGCDTAHAAWLGVKWDVDARETLELLRGARDAFNHPDWLVVDHYAIGKQWERSVRTTVDRIFAIDDLADREHDCDLLLDQNLVQGMESRYETKVERNCRLMIGPRFALLQPQYAENHVRARARHGAVRRILIYFGGADRLNLTGRAVEACLRLERTDTYFDIVISPRHPCREQIERLICSCDRDQFNIHIAVPSLAELMVEADLALGAGGVSNWERLCLGLPTIVVTLADNQLAIARALHDAGLIVWLGKAESVSVDQIYATVSQQIDRGLDAAWSRRCKNTVDGQGVSRVVAAMTFDPKGELLIRPANLGDERLILTWANDAETRRNSFSGAVIEEEAHKKWFASKLSRPDICKMWIAETPEHVAVGQVRFDFSEQGWSIDYSVGREFRGLGIGKRLLQASICAAFSDDRGAKVYGEVKKENIASRKTFESLSFRGEESKPGTFKYCFQLAGNE